MAFDSKNHNIISVTLKEKILSVGNLITLFSCFLVVFSFGQIPKEASQIFIPNTTSTHPFGVYIGRIQHHHLFNYQPKNSWSLNVSSGNIWLPEVIANIPSNQIDRDAASELPWHKREGYFDFNKIPSQTLTFSADGVIRLYQPQFMTHFGTKHNIILSTRIISFDSGKFPFSTFTNDKVIEWVHSNIAGGEDPFARKAKGLNNPAHYSYTDRNNNTVNLHGGQIELTGVDFTHYYFPKIKFLNSKHIDLRTGLHTSVNTSKINAGLDFGTSFAARKWKNTRKGNQHLINVSYGLLRQKLIAFSEGVELSNRMFIRNAELTYTYVFMKNPERQFALSAMIFNQTSYLKHKEFDYAVLKGNRASSHWHYAISHLYKKVAGVNLMASLQTNQWSYTIYITEDIPVNNAPDIQTGISIKMDW